MARGGLDVALGRELRQQDDRVALVQRGLAHGETVHVIERCRHQRALALRHRPAHALADRPEVRVVRQHHALGPAGRARGVEEHRRFLGLHLQRRERALGVDAERREVLVEGDLGHAVRRELQARVVADHQLGVAVVDDVGHGLGRQLVVHRHRHQARLHGAEEGEQELGAVGRQDGDAIAALQSALQQPARHRAAQADDVAVGVGALAAVAAGVDQRQRVLRNVARDRVALVVVRDGHHGMGYSTNSNTAFTACLAGTTSRPDVWTTPAILPSCNARAAFATETVRNVRPAM